MTTNKGEGVKVGIPVFPTEDLEVKDRGFNQRNVIHSPNGISRTIIGCGGGGYSSGNQPKVAIPVLTPDRAKKRQNGRRMKENGEPTFTITAQDRHGVAVSVEPKGYDRIAHAPYNNGRMDGRTGVFSTESGVPALNATMGKEPYKVAIETENHKDSHDGIYVKLSEDVVVYAIWYERYKCYIAIRKLTPKECFRLQGWSDDYFERAAFVNSNSQLYKQAGNGVTVNVIQAIAEKMK